MDTVLGVFTGVFAYYLYERHPRTAIPADEKLGELLKWRWEKYQTSRMRELQALDTSSSP
jgi:hypothetical protein